MPVFLSLKSKPWFSVGCFTDYKVVFWFGLVWFLASLKVETCL